MDSLLTYILPLVILPLSIYLVFRNGRSNEPKLPPGSNGWPMLGENMAFALLGPEKFVKDRMNKYSSDVFRTSLLGEKVAILCGAQGNKFLFTNENKLVTSWLPQSMKKALISPDFVDGNLKEVTARGRSFHYDILKPEALKKYIPIMDELARAHLDVEWAPHGMTKVYHSSKTYTFSLACKLFLSITDPEHIKRLADPFAIVTKGMFSFPIDFPGTAYNRAIKGGKMVRDELIEIIKKRRKEMTENNETEGQDLLSCLLLVKDEDGQFLRETEISNNIMGLLVASFDTTSSAVTTVVNYLAELPHIYDGVLKEQMEIAKSKGPDDLLTWEDIEKMKYSWNVVRESLRLTSPAQGAFRETTTEFTYAGFTIPKGWKTFWTVNTTHKNPKFFPNPEQFDPSRFEGSGPAPYTFVPFGGGPRMCPGKEYARMQVLVFIHNVVRRFKLEKAIPNENIIFHASPMPKYGLPVLLIPHEK